MEVDGHMAAAVRTCISTATCWPAIHGTPTWDGKVRDIHEFLVEIDFRPPRATLNRKVTYHASCHLAHGQKVKVQPEQVVGAIPGIQLVELLESDWCSGSAGIYNITHPGISMKLLDQKMDNILPTGARVVASGNPECSIQLNHGCRRLGTEIEMQYPISMLAAAYRAEEEKAV